MRKSTSRGALALGLLLCSTAGPARAQFPGFNPAVNPSQRPTISPYLNLTRGGNQAVNYYGLVRPQENFQNAQVQLQQEVNTAQQTANVGIQGVIDRNLPPTGHRVGFQTQGRYFQTLGQGTSLGAAGGFTGAGGGTSPFLNQGVALGQGALGAAGAQGPAPARGR